MSANKLSGRNTLQYKAIRKNYTHIILNFVQVLTKLKALCFEKELIATNENVDPRQPLYDQSDDLLRNILKKVEFHQKWYDVFLIVLDEFPELRDIKLAIQGSYASEIHSKNVLPTNLDSGVSGVTESKNGDTLENAPVEELSGDDEQPINSEQNEDGVFPTSNSVAVSSEGVHSLAGTPIMFIATTSPLAGNYLPPESVETSSERTSQVVIQGYDNLSSKGINNNYLKSENKQLEEKIRKLRQTVKEQSKKIEHLGGEVSERDFVIDNFEKELTEIDELVQDKADQERNDQGIRKSIEEIKAKHRKGIEEVHEKKIEHLQNRISELECKERDAQLVLEKVKVELTNALLEKEKALSQLREKFHKAKMELEILLEEEKTQHANLLRSLSEEKERKAKAEAHHAEEREKMMRDEAQRAREESEHNKGLVEGEKDLLHKGVGHRLCQQLYKVFFYFIKYVL